MLYALVVAFIDHNSVYISERRLTLQHCAGRAAMARTEYLAALPKLSAKIGEVRYYCLPEKDLSK